MFSSKTDMWETPQWLFDKLNQQHKFDLDVCATESNKKCERYFSPEDDGLNQKWSGVCWCNPPYGREISKWVEKAYMSVKSGEAEKIVMLLPARTDTKYFHQYIYSKSDIEFLKGRLKFSGCKNSAPFPSMIVIYQK